MIVTRRLSLSERDDAFLLRVLVVLVLFVCVKLTVLLTLVALIRVAESLRTINP